MNKPREQPLVYTVSEAVKLLKIGRGLVYKAIRDKQIPSFRIGRRIQIPKLGLERWMNETMITDVKRENVPGRRTSNHH
jgi:excisionase family DNA binding protein